MEPFLLVFYCIENLFQFHFLLAAAAALINPHQFSLLYIELFFFHYFPLVKATATQCFTLVLIKRTRLFKLDHITHCLITFALTIHINLHISSCRHTRGPGPLKIKATQMTGDINHFAYKKQTRLRFCLHGFGR